MPPQACPQQQLFACAEHHGHLLEMTSTRGDIVRQLIDCPQPLYVALDKAGSDKFLLVMEAEFSSQEGRPQIRALRVVHGRRPTRTKVPTPVSVEVPSHPRSRTITRAPPILEKAATQHE